MSGNRTRRDWDWHRLDAEWAQRIVADAGIRPAERVIDIGAGTGSLTAALVAAGARVLAVELHPKRVAQLRARFAGGSVTVVQADISEFHWPRQGFRVVANPPFQLSTPLLRALLHPRSALRRADLVLQRAVVNRYVTDRPPRRFTAARGLSVPRSAFDPRPQVDAAVLKIQRS